MSSEFHPSKCFPLVLVLALAGHCWGEELYVEPGSQLTNRVQVTVDAQSVDIPCLIYMPTGYRAEGKYPLVLFLHGLGECGLGGRELPRVAIHGFGARINRGEDFPFVLVSPQQPPVSFVHEKIISAWNPQQLAALLDRLEAELAIDRERVYVTGLSMGGFGTWRLASTYPERFAAIAPICGGGEPEIMGPKLAKMPVWAFHGAKDELVKADLSHAMVGAIRAAGGTAKLTIYPEVGHDSWVGAYSGSELSEWLLSHKKLRR